MQFDELICCPSCRGELGVDACSDCGRQFCRNDRQFRFVSVSSETVDAVFQKETQNRTSLGGWLFSLGKLVLSSEFQPRNHLKAFLKDAHGVIVELGSGSRRLRPDVLNIDLFPSANVDIVADIAETPLKDGCADFVILDSVIEHVPDPVAVTREARRILKPGGQLLVNCPFMLPYHGYPGHYQNFTRDGLLYLLRDFSQQSVRPTLGPMTAWVNMTAETFAVMVAGERGFFYLAAKAAILVPIFWLKYLDALFVRAERSHRVAGMLCALATK